jgi:hypothetical protein
MLTGQAFLQNQSYIIRDRFVLNAALNDPALTKLPVLQEQTDRLQWLENEIKVEFPGPEFIQISMSGDQTDQLLVIVRAIRKAYLEKTGDKEVTEREDQLKTLRDIYAKWEQAAKTNRAKLKLLQKEGTGINEENLALLQKLAIEELNAARKDLVKVRSDLRRLGIEIGLKPEWREVGWPPIAAALSSAPGPLTPVSSALVALLQDEFLASGRHVKEDIESLLSLDPLVAKEIQEIQRLELTIEGYRKTAQDDRVFEKLTKGHREKLALLKNYVLAYAQRKGEKGLQQLREKGRNDPKANLASTTRERYVVARELERKLLDEIQKLHEAMRDQNRVAVDLSDVKAEITKAEDIMKRVGKKIDALEIEQKAPPRVKEFGEGSIYQSDADKRGLRAIVAGSLAGLGLLLLTLAWYRLRSPKPTFDGEKAHRVGRRLLPKSVTLLFVLLPLPLSAAVMWHHVRTVRQEEIEAHNRQRQEQMVAHNRQWQQEEAARRAEEQARLDGEAARKRNEAAQAEREQERRKQLEAERQVKDLARLPIDPKTPLKDLLPTPPKSEKVAGPFLGDDLTRVPEVQFEERPPKGVPSMEAMAHLAHQIAKINRLNHRKTDGFVEALRGQRPDLSGLPFAMGDACRTQGERGRQFATAVAAVRGALSGRTIVDRSSAEQFWERYQVLCAREDRRLSRPGRVQPEGVAVARVAALMQVLAAMPPAVRLGLVKYLSAVAHVEATRALARLAIFSAEDEVRLAALDALKVRRERDCTGVLVDGLHYPWPAVACRATEAIVQLERIDLLPQLVGLLEEPDPRAPVMGEVDRKKVPVVRELVRVNHHRNCLLCHSPGNSGEVSKEVVTAAVPVPGQPLPAPSAGYNAAPSESLLVRVDVTYLRQDFSALQPVADAHPWPEMQRFDYLVRTRVLTEGEAKEYREKLTPRAPAEFSPYQRAALAALHALTGRDTEPTPAAWRRVLNLPSDQSKPVQKPVIHKRREV